MASFTVFTGLLMYLYVDKPLFVEVIGFLAVFIEAMLGAPQLLKNFYNKSTIGMRFS
jgi:solute carrier family 66, member 2